MSSLASLPQQRFERGNPRCRLTPRPTGRGDERRLDFTFSHDCFAAHDSLLNDHRGGTQFRITFPKVAEEPDAATDTDPDDEEDTWTPT